MRTFMGTPQACPSARVLNVRLTPFCSVGVRMSTREVPRQDADGLQQPAIAGAGDGLLARLRAELDVDVAAVGLDRVDRQEELAADLPLRQAGGQEPQHRALAGRERVAPRR